MYTTRAYAPTAMPPRWVTSDSPDVVSACLVAIRWRAMGLHAITVTGRGADA